MTTETKIRKLFEDYDDAKKALENEYEKRFDSISVNKAGEASADELLELNMWYVEKENAILKLFTEQVMKMQESGK